MSDRDSSLLVVLPVYNEEAQVESNTLRLCRFLEDAGWTNFSIVIANNGSTDDTLTCAEELSRRFARIAVNNFGEPGRGRALKATWLSRDADVLAYTDIDLSTSLESLDTVFKSVAGGSADLAVASRLLPGAQVKRGIKREVISRVYSMIVRMALNISVRDAQCGCKAISRSAARSILHDVEDVGWFFDTELLVLAHHHDLAIAEIPVVWTDDSDSRVNLVPTILKNIQGIARLRRRLRVRTSSIVSLLLASAMGIFEFCPLR